MAKRRRRPPGARDKDLHDPEFVELAPRFERFPGFVDRDFDAFAKPKQGSSAYNAERLVVKRKLAGLVNDIAPALAQAGEPLEGKTSLSHPYVHNGYRVASMWCYFGRTQAQKKRLKRTLGEDLGKDVDASAHGVILLVEIEESGLAHGLKIHPGAWWDARTLLRRLETPKERARLLELLRALPAGFTLGLSGYRRRRRCAELGPATLGDALSYYRPGEHWLEVLRETPREQAIARGAGLAAELAGDLAGMVALWRFVAWDGSL